MKGRRKVKSRKCLLQDQVEVEASRMLAKRSKKAAHRFLDAALVSGKDFEPTGRLAGNPPSSSLEKNRNALSNPQLAVRLTDKAHLAGLLTQTIEVVIRAGRC